METTAGATRSKMSAKDSGAPGGGAKIGAVDALISGGASAAMAAGHFTPTPATAAAATPRPTTVPAIKPFFLSAICFLQSWFRRRMG